VQKEENERINNLKDLAKQVKKIWKNERSWRSEGNSSYLLTVSEDDKLALRTWARNANLENGEKTVSED